MAYQWKAFASEYLYDMLYRRGFIDVGEFLTLWPNLQSNGIDYERYMSMELSDFKRILFCIEKCFLKYEFNKINTVGGANNSLKKIFGITGLNAI